MKFNINKKVVQVKSMLSKKIIQVYYLDIDYKRKFLREG
jgi:hypothetical protein